MLEFNIGELASRLRSSLGVRGRIPLGLDEHVVPVTITSRIDTPPWRRNPVFGQAALSCFTTTPGNFASITLAFSFGVSGVANSKFVITGWSIQPLSFVTATGAAVSGNAALARFSPSGAIPGGSILSQYNLLTTERYTVPNGPSFVPYRIPVDIRSLDAAPGGFAQNQEGQLQWSQSGVVQPPVFVPTEFMLQPGQTVNFFATHPASATDTSGIAVEVQGLFYGLGG